MNMFHVGRLTALLPLSHTITTKVTFHLPLIYLKLLITQLIHKLEMYHVDLEYWDPDLLLRPNRDDAHAA